MAFAPQPGITEGEDFVDHGGIGLAERLDGDIMFPDIEQFVVCVALVGSGDFLLTVTGTNFISSSVITFGGVAQTTALLDSTHVSATIPGSAIATAGENHSVEPTYTAAMELLSIGINQRSSFQWWAWNDDGKLVIPATSANGIGIKSLSHTGTPVTIATAQWNE